jgi:hypothetical protein
VPELAGLDEVPWADLEHAFGSAEDVPAMVRALLSEAAPDREAALEELRTTIWHQGTVYSATPPAVPFLVQIALADGVNTETRLWLVHQLAWIAESDGRNANGERTQVTHVDAARRALLPSLPAFVAWLEREREPNLQIALAALLAQFPERATEITPVIRSVMSEDEDARRILFYRLALVALAENEPVDVTQLPDDYFDDEARGGLAAAIANGEDPPATVRRALADLAGYASDL